MSEQLFTESRYDQAIKDLKLAKKAIAEPGAGCHVCGGDCLPHRCGRNPLYAMHMCQKIAYDAMALHHSLHVLSGVHTYMGDPIGPIAIIPPEREE